MNNGEAASSGRLTEGEAFGRALAGAWTECTSGTEWPNSSIPDSERGVHPD
jgi:hypothetical protein